MRQPTVEHRRWHREAASLGLTLSDYVRAKVNKTEMKVRKVTDPALFQEIRRAGINLNQLAHGQNAGWAIDNHRYEQALALFIEVYERILREYD